MTNTSNITTINDSNFAENTTGAVTVVDFWAPWCGPCVSFAPIFEAAAAEYGDVVRFAKCNVQDNPGAGGSMSIQSIPTLVLFGRDGAEEGRAVGAPGKADLDKMIRSVIEQYGLTRAGENPVKTAG